MVGTGTNLTLLIGLAVPLPAPLPIMEALESLSVTTGDTAPGGFQMQFHGDYSADGNSAFQLAAAELFVTGSRLVATVTNQGLPTVLMDGFITTQELTHDKAMGAWTFSVTGTDLTKAMDLVEVSLSYPGMGAVEIVETILAKYAVLGIVPEVIPPLTGNVPLPLDGVRQQNVTDLSCLNQLAAESSHVFFLRHGPVPLLNTAYWGPPPRLSMPQPALSVNMGSSTNVENISFIFDPTAASTYEGMIQDTDTEEDSPIVTLLGLREPPLAAIPSLGTNPLFQRRNLYNDPRLGAVDALAKAQAATDRSTDPVLQANGEVDLARYGSLLHAAGLVQLRGAGLMHDGLYYVRSVTTTLRRGSVRQQFSLSREGLLSTIPAVLP